MKRLIMATVLVTIATFMFVSVVKAADANMPKAPKAPKAVTVTVKGKVIATKDATGNITAAEISGKSKAKYNIVLDAKGKELAEKMADKMVKVTGTVETKDNEQWLTVEKYNEIEKPVMKPTPKQKKM